MANSYFNAFISYRHSPVDTAVAVEIQKKLERFHIPSQIQKKYGIKKFERIFRDTSELEITNDLAAQLDDAIRASDFLIVICSPRYMESPWCLREIEVFLQTHPRDHVLCVMAEGEPPGIFPPVLMQEAEPLACDYRGSFREAEKVELPRLACAMIGCSYDELIMRTTQYKRRRTTALVSVILTLAAIAVSYLLYSNARIRAQYQQTLINESKTLAAQSLEAMSARDRYHALSYALEALPSEDLDRPVTSEAVYALHKASGAYSLPYQVVQTKLFDGALDYEKMILLPNSGYLAAMDSSAVISVYDPSTGELISSFSVHSSEVLPDLLSTEEDLIVTSSAGLINAYQPDGTLVWQQDVFSRAPETYSTMDSRVHLSPDGSCLGSQDFDAVQVMNTQNGEPVTSYQLPENTVGVIFNFAWSPDGSALAVQLRLENGNDRFGVIETDHGKLTLLDGEFAYLADFYWNDLNQLLIFCRSSEQTSYVSGSTYEFMYFQDLSVFAYDTAGQKLFDTTVPFSAECYDIESPVFYIGNHPILLISAASCLSFFDPTGGDLLLSYDLGESIVQVIDVTSSTVRLITASGRISTVWFQQGESHFITQFPAGIRDVMIRHDDIPDLDHYFLLTDGDIYLFENAPDPSIVLADEPDDGMMDVPENLVMCGDFVALKQGADIRFYHLPDLEVIAKKSYGDQKAVLLLGTIPAREAAVVLIIDMDTGSMMLELLDMMNGDSLSSHRLSAGEYFFDSGVLDLYASYYEASDAIFYKRMLLESSYSSGSGGIYLSDNALFYHSYLSPNIICRLDLVHGGETLFTPNLSEGQNLLCGNFQSSLSPLIPSPDGKWLYSVVQEEGHEPRGVLIHTESESADNQEKVLLLPETESSSDLLAVWSKDSSHLAIAGASSILLYQKDGTLLTSIPYPGSSPLCLYFLSEGSLAVFYPGGRLLVYAADGTLQHETQLSFNELSYVNTSSFHISETKEYLVVLCQEQMELVDLHTFGARPDVTVPTHALGYSEATDQLLVFSHRYTDASMFYHLGAFQRYSLDELIKKSNEALSGIAPK